MIDSTVAAVVIFVFINLCESLVKAMEKTYLAKAVYLEFKPFIIAVLRFPDLESYYPKDDLLIEDFIFKYSDFLIKLFSSTPD